MEAAFERDLAQGIAAREHELRGEFHTPAHDIGMRRLARCGVLTPRSKSATVEIATRASLASSGWEQLTNPRPALHWPGVKMASFIRNQKADDL